MFIEHANKVFTDCEDGSIEVCELSHFDHNGEPVFESIGFVQPGEDLEAFYDD